MRSSKKRLRVVLAIPALLWIGCAGLFGPDLKPALEKSSKGDHAGALIHYEQLIAEGKRIGDQ